MRLLSKRSSLDIVEYFADCSSLARVVRQCSRPDSIRKGESVHIESCYNAKIIRAALKSPPEIFIRCSISINNLATGKNNLKVGYIRTRESTAAEKIRDAICRCSN